MIFYSIKEASEITGKSISTIKRVMSKAKNNPALKASNSKHFKYESLPTGNAKNMMSHEFLMSVFPTLKSIKSSGSSEPLKNESQDKANQEFIDFLKGQLSEKSDLLEKSQLQAVAPVNNELIDYLKNDIALKNKQLEIKEQQISKLIEQQSESNKLQAKSLIGLEKVTTQLQMQLESAPEKKGWVKRLLNK
jgi:hypothetical protein